MGNRTLSQKIVDISNQLDNIRFVGLDQNPKGIRDSLFSLSTEARQLEIKCKSPGLFDESDAGAQ